MMEKITSGLEKLEKTSWNKHHLQWAMKVEDFFFQGKERHFRNNQKVRGRNVREFPGISSGQLGWQDREWVKTVLSSREICISNHALGPSMV